MAPPRIEKIITALDVGSWKVCALIAGQTADGQLHVLGTGQRESRGVQRGYVADMERIGGHLWRHISPLTRKLLPLRSAAHATLFGMVWGWIPCGMVYAMLLSAISAGSA